MFCPKCGNEYREGFTRCSECNVDLVESLEQNEEDKENSVETKLVIDASDLLMQAIMEDEDLKEAVLQDDEVIERLEEAQPKHVKPYVLPEVKLKDYLDSTMILLCIGGIGIILILLSMFKVIDLPFGKMGMIMFYIVMGGLFVIFILSGLSSLRKYINLKSSMEYINKKEERIIEWCIKTFNPEFFEENILTQNEEELFFERISLMSKSISNEYPTIDESYLQYLVDKVYDTIFEE